VKSDGGIPPGQIGSGDNIDKDDTGDIAPTKVPQRIGKRLLLPTA